MSSGKVADSPEKAPKVIMYSEVMAQVCPERKMSNCCAKLAFTGTDLSISQALTPKKKGKGIITAAAFCR